MDKYILNFTPTGMIPMKNHSQFVPISSSEIIDDVLAATELGITLVHLHARDENGLPTYKSSYYRAILEKLRVFAPDLVICVSLSGRNFNEFEKRSEVLCLLPDMGSLTLSSLNFPTSASVNDPEMITKLALKMSELGVRPELEVFDLGMINFGKFLIKKGILKPPFYYNIIAGNIAGIQCDLNHLGLCVQSLPDSSFWAFGGIGPAQLSSNIMALCNGGGVRVGLEDNLYFDVNKEKKATNLELLKRIHQVADVLERPLMTSSEFGNLGFYNSKR
jgi:uncharacterized protein (DUF849 family)